MKNISRKRKLAICLLILFIALYVCISMSEFPSPTLEIAIHRKEKQQLIGPSKIIATMDFTFSPWDHLVLGKTEHGYVTYEYNDDLGWDNGDLTYYSREEEGTLFCTEYWYRTGEEEWLPIILFPDHQRSTGAIMSLSVTIEGETKTYQLEGERKDSSFYFFSLPVDELEGEHFWLLQQALTGAYAEYVISGTVDIEIHFFNAAGEVVDTYSRNVTK